MKRLSFSSLRVRLGLLVLLAVLPALAVVVYTGMEQKWLAAADAQAEALRLARRIAERQTRLAEETHRLLIALTKLPEVRQLNSKGCSLIFSDILKDYSLYTNLGAIRPNGDLFCSALPFSGVVNAADRLYFQRAVESRNFAAGEFQIGRLTKKPAINFGYPVLNERGDVQAVVFAALDLNWLNQFSAELNLPRGTVITLIDRKGVILARLPDPQLWAGKSAANTPIVKTVLAQQEGTSENVGLEGTDRIYSFTKIRGFANEVPPGFVWVSTPKEVIFAETHRIYYRNLTVLGFVLLLIFATAWVGTDRLVLRQVDTLVEATQRLAAGDLTARANLRSDKGELSELGRSFNQMAEQLQKTYRKLESEIIERGAAQEETCRLNAELDQRVVARTAELEAANKELEAFSYSVSHDLRAPLRSIDGFSQVLLEDYADKLDDEGKDYLQRVRASTQHMGKLIDDMLNLSRVMRAEMRREPVNLTGIAQALAAELQQSAPDREVEFIIADGLTAQGDTRLLRIVLDNLLGNAWKYTSKHPRARIEFGFAQNNGQSAYFVRDDGAGFDMAYADKLFGVFQRLHRQTEFSGTGVGLATVQRIMHRHGGQVWADAQVDNGATFYFTVELTRHEA